MAPTEARVLVHPTPNDYAAQANAISRGNYDMPALQRKLLFVVMSQLRPADQELLVMEMSVGAVIRALGLDDSGKQYDDLRKLIDGLMSRVITIDTGNGWRKFQWVSRAEYIKDRDTLQIRIHDDLRPYVLDLQGKFKKIGVKDIARLQGKYSLRFLEIALSYESLAGTGGNKPGCWYFDLEMKQIREMFQIGDAETKYRLTSDLRRYVIDGPIKEINNERLGFQILPDYEIFRSGRSLPRVRFNCRRLKADEPRSVNPVTLTESDDEKLKARYPEEYKAILKSIREEGFLGLDGDDRLVLDEAKAITLLREKKKKTKRTLSPPV